MWTEQYRPRTLGEVAGHADVVRELRSYVATRDPPHLLFYGPAGTGKTSAAHAFAREILGPWFGVDFLEVNASDDRSLTALRAKVIPFARLRPWNGIHVVFLDEADGLAPDAQDALRRPMELYASTTRFVLAANKAEEKLSEAIFSRCRALKFWPLQPRDVLGRLRQIAAAEEADVPDALLEGVAERCGGDLRLALTTLRAQLEVAP